MTSHLSAVRMNGDMDEGIGCDTANATWRAVQMHRDEALTAHAAVTNCVRWSLGMFELRHWVSHYDGIASRSAR